MTFEACADNSADGGSNPGGPAAFTPLARRIRERPTPDTAIDRLYGSPRMAPR